MSSHPDADGLVRSVLTNPADPLPRLVLADWLDESGTESNANWAAYIREQAGDFSWDAARDRADIRARLTISADRMIRCDGLLRLLPVRCFKLRLSCMNRSVRMLRLMPESLAREHQCVPLAQVGPRTLFIGTPNSTNGNTLQILEFILDQRIVPFDVGNEDAERAIDRIFGDYGDTESVDSGQLFFSP